VWIILESTGAQYLRPFGAAEDPTPRLTALADESVLFPAAYAVYPESIKGLFSMLCAAAPAMHTAAPRHAEDVVPCRALPAELAAAGYRTALFHSGRFVYLGMRDVIRDRGFQLMEDAGKVGGKHASSFGTADQATVDRALGWVDTLPREDRFLLAYMPISGHHPYHAPGDGPRPFPEDTDLSRYRNDLFGGDAAFGALLDGLRARGHWDDTLFVVNGDHAEAFHQHQGNFAHSLFVYEENLHVPLLFSAPGITSGTLRAPQVATVMDIPPTVLHLLGLPVPERYDGASLLVPTPRVARFFTDHATTQVGLRDGRWKLIHEVEAGRSRLFDLDVDPGETRDLAESDPARTSRYRDHLLGWLDSQRDRIHRYREVVSVPGSAPP
jgi:lipoteichoic acid synthase